jgi:hypothetical protein
MQCPKCERELTLMGAIGIQWDIKSGEVFDPIPVTKIFTCMNTKCKNYKKSLRYNVAKQQWK